MRISAEHSYSSKAAIVRRTLSISEGPVLKDLEDNEEEVDTQRRRRERERERETHTHTQRDRNAFWGEVLGQKRRSL